MNCSFWSLSWDSFYILISFHCHNYGLQIFHPILEHRCIPWIVSFDVQKFHIWMKSIYLFLLFLLMLFMSLKKFIAKFNIMSSRLMFSSESFVIWALTFRPSIHFMLILWIVYVILKILFYLIFHFWKEGGLFSSHSVEVSAHRRLALRKGGTGEGIAEEKQSRQAEHSKNKEVTHSYL